MKIKMKKYLYYTIVLFIVSLPNFVFAQIPAPQNPGLPTGTVSGAIGKITNFIAGIIAVLAILMIVVSGIMYMTSGGDSGKVETAKSWLIYSVVGLVVAILAFVIVNAVGGALGAW